MYPVQYLLPTELSCCTRRKGRMLSLEEDNNNNNAHYIVCCSSVTGTLGIPLFIISNPTKDGAYLPLRQAAAVSQTFDCETIHHITCRRVEHQVMNR